MEPVYVIGAGAIGKVLAVCLVNEGKKVVLLRGSVDHGETHRENIRVTLSSQEIIEAEVTIDTLGNYRGIRNDNCIQYVRLTSPEQRKAFTWLEFFGSVVLSSASFGLCAF